MNDTPAPDRQRFPVEGDVGEHEPEANPDYAEVVAFFGHIAYLVKPLRHVLAQHLLDGEGEMLPNLLMSDVTGWLLTEYNFGATVHASQAMHALEQGYRDGSQELRSVMVVSFLEQIPGFAGLSADPEGIGARIRQGLGPTLRVVLSEVEQWRDPEGRHIG